MMNWVFFCLLLVFWTVVIGGLAWLIWHYRNYPDRKALIGRCNFQHQCLMDGHTDIGTYGLYPPADL